MGGGRGREDRAARAANDGAARDGRPDPHEDRSAATAGNRGGDSAGDGGTGRPTGLVECFGLIAGVAQECIELLDGVAAQLPREYRDACRHLEADLRGIDTRARNFALMLEPPFKPDPKPVFQRGGVSR